MKRTKPQFSRLLELDRAIRSGKYPNCLTFSTEWEVSQKTVQRDIDYLRDQLGAPLEYDRFKKGFCYTDNTWFLPSLSLSEGDLFALLVASRALEPYRGTPIAKELERIFNRVAELLPDRVSLRPELIFSRFSFTSPPSKPVDEKVWTAVVRALLTQTRLKIKYRAFEAVEPRERLLSPCHIANLQGEWYVFGPVNEDTEIRQYSLARIKDPVLTEKHFELPDDFDPAALLSRTFGRMAVGEKLHRVRLLFNKAVADWATERAWHPSQKVIHRKTGEVEIAFDAYGLLEVMRWVLAWGGDVSVLAPVELREMVLGEARRIVKSAKAQG